MHLLALTRFWLGVI